MPGTPEPSGRPGRKSRRFGSALDWSPAILLALMMVAGALVEPNLLSRASAYAVLSQSIPVFLVALAAGIVLVSGSIDLSAGLTVALVSVLLGAALSGGWPLAPSLIFCMLAALAVGAWNGLMVSWLKLPAFVATLATAIALQGINTYLSPGIVILRDTGLKVIGRGNVAGIPMLYVIAALAGVLAHLLMRRTPFGMRTFAIGSNRESAALAGLNTARQQFAVFVVAAAFSFLAAVVLVSRTLTVTPNVGGMPLLLDAIAAAVIGGTSLFGGKGTVPGILCGALFIGLFTHLLRAIGVDPSSLELAKGLLICAALLIDVGLQTLAAWSRRPVLQG